jgi:amino acid transporter
MTEVAMKYLPWGAAAFVTLGAIMAITTSLNPTLIVPSRLALIFVEDGLAPAALGSVNRRTATPVVALTLNLIACLVLLVSPPIGFGVEHCRVRAGAALFSAQPGVFAVAAL